MTLREKLAQIDKALEAHSFAGCYAFTREYREMIAECVKNEYPGPNHITDAEEEARHDMPTM